MMNIIKPDEFPIDLKEEPPVDLTEKERAEIQENPNAIADFPVREPDEPEEKPKQAA